MYCTASRGCHARCTCFLPGRSFLPRDGDGEIWRERGTTCNGREREREETDGGREGEWQRRRRDERRNGICSGGRKERGTCSPPLKLPRTSESLDRLCILNWLISEKMIKSILAWQDILVLRFNVGPKSYKKQSDICQNSIRKLSVTKMGQKTFINVSEFCPENVRCKYLSKLIQNKFWNE